MTRKRIEMILKIHQACTKPLYDVLKDISDEQFNWHAAPESRSINQIMCHLIRIDNSFMKKLGKEIITKDPGNGSPDDVLNALMKVHEQFHKLVENCSDDIQLLMKSTIPDANEMDTINEHMLHSCQHNLYHLAQMIYLRRALDRNWLSPIDEWDKATRIIANYLSPVKEYSLPPE